MKRAKVEVTQSKIKEGIQLSSPKHNPHFLKTASQALNYCLMECPDHKLGCAVDCRIRKHFKIPPHGSHYPGD